MPIMQVSRKIDYALRAVIHLANEEAGDRACSVAEIASRERIPTVAQYRRRYPLPFPQAHPPPGLIWMNERESGYRGAR